MSSSPIRLLCALSFALSLGLLLNVLACTSFLDASLPPNATPLFATAIYLMAPCPTFLCGGRGCGGGSAGYAGLTTPAATPFRDLGFFFAGMLMTAGLGVPALLAHARVISGGAALLSLAGGLVVYGTISGYIHAFSAPSSSLLGL